MMNHKRRTPSERRRVKRKMEPVTRKETVRRMTMMGLMKRLQILVSPIKPTASRRKRLGSHELRTR
jgi:hypothetical protein